MSLRQRIDRLTAHGPAPAGEAIVIDSRGGGELRHIIRRGDGTEYPWTPERTPAIAARGQSSYTCSAPIRSPARQPRGDPATQATTCRASQSRKSALERARRAIYRTP